MVSKPRNIIEAEVSLLKITHLEG